MGGGGLINHHTDHPFDKITELPESPCALWRETHADCKVKMNGPESLLSERRTQTRWCVYRSIMTFNIDKYLLPIWMGLSWAGPWNTSVYSFTHLTQRKEKTTANDVRSHCETEALLLLETSGGKKTAVWVDLPSLILYIIYIFCYNQHWSGDYPLRC